MERQVRKLAHSLHAPAEWIFHAKMVVRSWEGQRTRQIAQALGRHPQTVRERLHAFNERAQPSPMWSRQPVESQLLANASA